MFFLNNDVISNLYSYFAGESVIASVCQTKVGLLMMSCDSIKSLLGYYHFRNVLLIAILLLFQIMCNFALFCVTSQFIS